MTNEKDFPPNPPRPSETALAKLYGTRITHEPAEITPVEAEEILQQDKSLREKIVLLAMILKENHVIEKPHDPKCPICSNIHEILTEGKY